MRVIAYSQLEFLTYMRASKHPVMAPFHSSTYSDGGYGILTILLERLTGLEYPDAVQTILNQPLNLTDLVVGAPNGSDINVIDRRPIDSTSSWGLDIPVVAGYGCSPHQKNCIWHLFNLYAQFRWCLRT